MTEETVKKLQTVKQDLLSATKYLNDWIEECDIVLWVDKKEVEFANIKELAKVSEELKKEGYTGLKFIRAVGSVFRMEAFSQLKDDQALEKLANIFEELATDLRKCKNETA